MLYLEESDIANLDCEKILILSANPNNTDRLRLDVEVREIQQAVRSARHEQLEIVAEWAIGIDELRRALLYHQPTIVHFSGHGAGIQGLVVENSCGQAQLLATEALAELFRLFSSEIECVFLNACHSQAQAEAIHQYIDYVVGMKKEIKDTAAIKFAIGFYEALGACKTYQQAYQLGCNTIKSHGLAEFSTPIIRVNPRLKFSSVKQLAEIIEPQVNTSAGTGISINVSGSQISGGFALVQGKNNHIAQETYLGAPVTGNQLSQEEVIQMLATIEQIVESTEELPETIKQKSLKYLGRAKEELELPQPDKKFAACDLKQMAQMLINSSKEVPANKTLWQSIEPILMELPAWLDVPRSFFK